jgi:hypothetical protein
MHSRNDKSHDSSIAHLLKKEKELKEVAPTFANVAGVVGGAHIRIVAPPAEHPLYPGHAYYCRKGLFSINTQIIICDSNSEVLIYSVVREICVL